jgi:O-antigen/teichoic acid export membrane protein
VLEFIKQSWVFPVLQSVHIIGLTFLVGSISLVDFRLLGVALRKYSTEELASRLAPWTSGALLTVLITGPLLFGSDLPRYLKNPAFVLKMVLLAVALAAHSTIHRNMVRGYTNMKPSTKKLVAILSLILWSSVILAGRAIADFDIRSA